MSYFTSNIFHASPISNLAPWRSVRSSLGLIVALYIRHQRPTRQIPPDSSFFGLSFFFCWCLCFSSLPFFFSLASLFAFFLRTFCPSSLCFCISSVSLSFSPAVTHLCVLSDKPLSAVLYVGRIWVESPFTHFCIYYTSSVVRFFLGGGSSL